MRIFQRNAFRQITFSCDVTSGDVKCRVLMHFGVAYLSTDFQVLMLKLFVLAVVLYCQRTDMPGLLPSSLTL